MHVNGVDLVLEVHACMHEPLVSESAVWRRGESCNVKCLAIVHYDPALFWRLGIVLSMPEYLRKMVSINKLGSILRELVCKLLEPLTCSEIVSFMDVVLIAWNMISTASQTRRYVQ